MRGSGPAQAGRFFLNKPAADSRLSAGAEEDEGAEKDPAKMERKERERRKEEEGQPPPIPEKVKKRQELEVTVVF